MGGQRWSRACLDFVLHEDPETPLIFSTIQEFMRWSSFGTELFLVATTSSKLPAADAELELLNSWAES